ncbi:hypothetical protein Vretifemale_20626, partial [Volvox reticuliferus]
LLGMKVHKRGGMHSARVQYAARAAPSLASRHRRSAFGSCGIPPLLLHKAVTRRGVPQPGGGSPVMGYSSHRSQHEDSHQGDGANEALWAQQCRSRHHRAEH